MRQRFIVLFALLVVLASACSNSGGNTEPPTAAVSVTVALSASEVGAATLTYWLSHDTALDQPLSGNVAVADPVTTFRITQLPVATGYTPVSYTHLRAHET